MDYYSYDTGSGYVPPLMDYSSPDLFSGSYDYEAEYSIGNNQGNGGGNSNDDFTVRREYEDGFAHDIAH